MLGRYGGQASAIAAIVIVLADTLVQRVDAHSWLEQLQVIGSGGNFTGDYGYSRGYMSRTEAGFNGDSVDYLLPPLTSDRIRINSTDLLCHPSQRTANYSSSYPQLNVNPSSYVSMKYLENGHVTLPQNQIGKPLAAGTVFVYGTTDPRDDEKIVDVLEWTADGSGGDGRGVLLTAQNFDDGRCHQMNSGTISLQRQQDFPDRNAGQPLSQVEQWCETDLQVPSTAATGKSLTIYWIWQWPTEPGADPTYPDGKDEYYTTCVDLNVVSDPIEQMRPVHTLQQQDPQTTACSDFTARTADTLFPSVTTAAVVGSSTAYGALSLAASAASSTTTSTTTTASLSASSSAVSTNSMSSATTTMSESTSAAILSSVSVSAASSFIAQLSSAVQGSSTSTSSAAVVTVTITGAPTTLYELVIVTVTGTPSSAAASPATLASSMASTMSTTPTLPRTGPAAVLGTNGAVGQDVRRDTLSHRRRRSAKHRI